MNDPRTLANLGPARSQSSIYFIQAGDGGPIKIGIAVNVRSRLYTLQVANPEKLTLLHSHPGSPGLEKALHQEWAEHRLRGEWFKPARDILLHISRQIHRRGQPLHEHAVKMAAMGLVVACHPAPPEMEG